MYVSLDNLTTYDAQRLQAAGYQVEVLADEGFARVTKDKGNGPITAQETLQ